MKNNIKNRISTVLSILIFTLLFVSCSDGDGDADYGMAYIYMPQATSSGGLNNNYLVPSGDGEYTYNFRVKSDKIDIMLGVLRSGLLSNSAYTVDIISRPDTTAQILSQGTVEEGILLSQELYSIPSNIEVPGDKSSATFYMSVPLDVLKHSEYTGKKLVTTIGITNPSKFQLNTQKASTVVIIDVDNLLNIIDK